MKEYYQNRYSGAPSVVLGFHGCHRDVLEQTISSNEHLKPSQNVYDWLGTGIYFWEANPNRAEEWAKERYGDNWGVIGAFIELQTCLNLLEQRCLDELELAYDSYLTISKAANQSIQKNTNSKRNLNSDDLLNRKLDCAVINHLHSIRKGAYDTVRGVFWEGEELYPNAGFKKRNHIQISVVNPKSILAYFMPKCFEF
ncbi:MAG: hypothetical protein LBV04_00635 [Deferribacteraceae bacterium]|jgi:hypothetical protein|nr:hypothetical protein [Deferribacteraceae bacterium]